MEAKTGRPDTQANLTPLPSRGGGNLIIRVFHAGGGEFDAYALGVGNLNCTLDVI